MMWRLWRLAKEYRTTPSDILSVSEPIRAFLLNRGIWYFGSKIESEMEERAQHSKNSNQAQGARYQVLMENLYPDNPEKRFRSPQRASSGKAGPAMGGEDYFTANAGKRRRS